MTEIASGNGVNFARAVRCWGAACTAVLHPLGGDTGAKLAGSMKKEGLESAEVAVAAPTRTCCTLMCRETGTATEIIEPSGTISAEEYKKLITAAESELKRSDALAICGTYPPGFPETCYEHLSATAAAMGKPVLLDAYKGIGEALNRGVTVLKINSGELSALTGCRTIEEGIRICLENFQLQTVAITAGKDFAVIGDRKRIVRIGIPRIENAVNPIGAGDTCAGVFFSNYIAGMDSADAFMLGLCAATASCMTGTPAQYDKSTAESLLKKISFTELKG
jgi:6-phosphofructokinase 2